MTQKQSARVRVSILALLATFPAASILRLQAADPLAEARLALRQGRWTDGRRLLDQILEREPADDEALYLKGECLALAGKAEVLGVIDRLRRDGRDLEADILDLKIDLFLGDSGLKSRLATALAAYPGSEEVRFVEWRRRVDEGDLDWAGRYIPDTGRIVFGSQPYEALFFAYRDSEPRKALEWAEKASRAGFSSLAVRANYRLIEQTRSARLAAAETFDFRSRAASGRLRPLSRHRDGGFGRKEDQGFTGHGDGRERVHDP